MQYTESKKKYPAIQKWQGPRTRSEAREVRYDLGDSTFFAHPKHRDTKQTSKP
jgi:hypothetical protein